VDKEEAIVHISSLVFVSGNSYDKEAWQTLKAFVESKQTDTQQTHYAILREIMEGLKSAMRKKDGSVFFQASVSSESWDILVGAKQHNT
jgi:hypothetical protein